MSCEGTNTAPLTRSQLAGGGGVVVREVDGLAHLDVGLGEDLAGLRGGDLDQLTATRFERLRPPPRSTAARSVAGRAPQRLCRRAHAGDRRLEHVGVGDPRGGDRLVTRGGRCRCGPRMSRLHSRFAGSDGSVSAALRKPGAPTARSSACREANTAVSTNGVAAEHQLRADRLERYSVARGVGRGRRARDAEHRLRQAVGTDRVLAPSAASEAASVPRASHRLSRVNGPRGPVSTGRGAVLPAVRVRCAAPGRARA